jgi:integration host factor subunit beta
VNRSELIARLAAHAPSLTIKDAEVSVSLILASIGDALASGGRVEIRGFGSFGLIYRPQRTARNPKSGEQVQVPGKYVPRFKAGKELRKRVDNADERSALHRATEWPTTVRLVHRAETLTGLAERKGASDLLIAAS